jgi:predicted AAA+ superfamily ATPase
MKTYLKRNLEIQQLIKDRSCFLLGPRQSGKSSYLIYQLEEKPGMIIDFLQQDTYFLYQRQPSRLRQICDAKNLKDTLIVIDEIQRFPDILMDVHWLIEHRNIRFLLTGSSARQLKRKGTSLLGGRARMRNLHPLSWCEIPDFNIDKAIYGGTLPPHWTSSLIEEDLAAYVGRYLSEEIAAEGLTRSLPQFTRFLEIAATMNGQLMNLSMVASHVGLNRQTITGWFQILYDTHLAFELKPWEKQGKRKLSTLSKFYFFDLGVTRFLKRLGPIVPSSKDFGDAFEHFVFLEIQTWIDYKSPQSRISFWRTQRGEYEVDFLLEIENQPPIALEVKASDNIIKKHIAGLKALQQEGIAKEHIIVCQEPEPRWIESEQILILPWAEFLNRLWAGRLIYQESTRI